MKARIALGVLAALLLASRSEANVIFVTTTAQKITSTGGCSLQEAIFSANFDNNIAINSVNGDGTPHFIGTQCLPGGGTDRIILTPSAAYLMSTIVDDPASPFGPAATPMIDTTITIEAFGARLEWIGSIRARAFVVDRAGSLSIVGMHLKGFSARGGNGADEGGGGMGAGGAIFVREGFLAIRESTFERNGAIGGNGGAGSSQGGGGGLSGNGGHGSSTTQYESGGGGGGSRGNGGNGVYFGGGGGGGTVRAGGNGQFIPNFAAVGGAGGVNCGGKGGNEDQFSQDGQCDGGGGGGGSVAATSFADSRAGSGAYGGGGGGGGTDDDGTGGAGGFGGGGGSCGSGSGIFTIDDGGTGGVGGGGGGCSGVPGLGGILGGDGGQSGGGGGAGLGGAIFSDGGSVIVDNSTFTRNFTVGGIGANTGFHGGNAGGENGGDAGGAIFAWGGDLVVRNSTIYTNQTTGSGGGIVAYRQIVNTTVSGPFGVDIVVPVFFGNPSLILFNTIVGNNGVIDALGNAVVAADQCSTVGFTSLGFGNLIQGNDNCDGVVSTSDPLLGPLQVNAPGNTPTLAILAQSSGAYNNADPNTSLLTDQRGMPRPKHLGYDIGAFEFCLTNQFTNVNCIRPPAIASDPIYLTIDVSPSSGGSASPPSGDYQRNSIQQLVATPAAGWAFVNWSGAPVANPNSASTLLNLDAPYVVFANFTFWTGKLTGRGTPGTATAPPRIDLTWLGQAGAHHYDVFRSTTSGGPSTLVGSSTTTVFSDRTAGLVNGGTFYYIVKAVDAGGVSFGSSTESMVKVPNGR